jgi:hypothetical protein
MNNEKFIRDPEGNIVGTWNVIELCPLCDSPRIISARHDNDWGGENLVGAINSTDKYIEGDLDENGDVWPFGDIDIRVCLACDFTWQRYTKIQERIAQLRAQIKERNDFREIALSIDTEKVQLRSDLAQLRADRDEAIRMLDDVANFGADDSERRKHIVAFLSRMAHKE